MARCDTCPYARWDGRGDTTVWCRKKKRTIKVGRMRHLFAVAKHIRQEVGENRELK